MSNILANHGPSFQNQKRSGPDQSNTILDNQIFTRLSKSRWFTRGWTLQELLAPSREVFFAFDWTVLGDRNGMSNWIADITRIHIGALRDKSTIPRYTIAQRMSWAAARETTRLEDIAYCLLGIFEIYMPLLYGEGDAAFMRLQQEIISISDDHSIFSWNLQGDASEFCTGALATSPTAFLTCGSVVRNDDIWRYPYSVTNLGISIEFPLIRSWYEGIDLVELNCVRELRGHGDPLDILPNRRTVWRRVKVWIFLRQVQHNIYQRVHLPASTVLLQPSYVNSMQQAKTALFIEIQKSPQNPPLLLPELLIPTCQKPAQDSLFSSGVMITFGWGTTNRFNRYQQAFSPGPFCSITVKGRSPMGISHQLVSNQNFSMLFSVAWNQSMQPQHWTHSVFLDPDGEFSSSIISVDKWKGLLVEDTQGSTEEVGNSIEQMSRIHEQLRHGFGEAFQHVCRLSITPIVLVSLQELENLHGQRELLIEVIFRESPELEH